MKECADTLTMYENLLSELGNIAMPEFKTSREANFRAVQISQCDELKGLSKYQFNGSLQANLYIFENDSEKCTEFVKMSPSGDKIEPMAQFPVIFSHVTQH